MAFFDWDEKYSVGIMSIDQQHKKLFDLISNFYEAIRQKETRRAMSEVLQGFLEYAETHFSTEEDYMRKYRYPLYERHAAQHAEFVEKVTDFQARFQSGALVIPIEIANFSKDWFSGHVLGEDQRYAPFFHEKGLA
jgi:hemerythrin-like metal-binding protein